MSLIQLVPTAGGSFRARFLGIPLVGRFASLASNLSTAENPYGPLAKKPWSFWAKRWTEHRVQPSRSSFQPARREAPSDGFRLRTSSAA